MFVTGTLSIVTEKKKRQIGKSADREKAQNVVVRTYVKPARKYSQGDGVALS